MRMEANRDNLGRRLGETARAIDEEGKKAWKEHEPQFREGSRRAGYVAAVVANLICFYIMNNLLAWGVPFLTGAFVAPLAVFNLSILITVAANVLYLVYDPRWFRLLGQLFASLVGLAALYTLHITFPFDFGDTSWEPLARVTLIVAMVGTGIGVVVNVVQLLLGSHKD